MKMNVTRVQAMMDHDDPKTMLNLSMQASKSLAQILQACGIRVIRLSTVETMGGHELKPTETTFFDGVPFEIAKWVTPAIDAIAVLMSAFGISSISLEADRKDMAELRRSWSYLTSDETQLKQVREAGMVVPQENAAVSPRTLVQQDDVVSGMPTGDPDSGLTPKESTPGNGSIEVIEL